MPGTCFRCHKSVIYAEEIRALGNVWHTHCFLCANCNKRLNNINVHDRDGETFCNQCYANLIEPRRQVFVASRSLSQSELVIESSNVVVTSPEGYRSNEYNDQRATSPLRINYNSDRHQPFLARTRYSSTKKFSSRDSSPCRPYKTSYQFKNFRYEDKICGRCNKTVYLTENVYGAGAEQSWHQACFKCNKCEKRLDSISVQTYGGEIYCIACSNNYHFTRRKF